MKKDEFLSALGERLAGLPEEDVQKTLSYYGEMIDDRMEDGVPEEEAVEALGSVDAIAEQTVSETPITKIVKERMMPKRKIRPLEIVLLVLGAPLWFPLLVAAAVLLLAFFVILWVGTAVLGALVLGFGCGSFACVLSAVRYFIAGSPAAGVCFIGGSMICLGLTLLFVPATFYTAKGTARLCKNIILGIKNKLIKGGRDK